MKSTGTRSNCSNNRLCAGCLIDNHRIRAGRTVAHVIRIGYRGYGISVPPGRVPIVVVVPVVVVVVIIPFLPVFAGIIAPILPVFDGLRIAPAPVFIRQLVRPESAVLIFFTQLVFLIIAQTGAILTALLTQLLRFLAGCWPAVKPPWRPPAGCWPAVARPPLKSAFV